jgi:hypothetical protein
MSHSTCAGIVNAAFEVLEPRRLLSVTPPLGLPTSISGGDSIDGAIYVDPNGDFETADFDLDSRSPRPGIDAASDVLLYTMAVDVAGSYTITVGRDDPGSSLDTVLAVYDQSQSFMAIAADDDGGPGLRDSELTVALDADQLYVIGIASFNNATTGEVFLEVNGPAQSEINVPISAGLGFGIVNDATLSDFDDVEYYRFTAPANATGIAGDVTVEPQAGSNLNASVSLYDGSGDLLGVAYSAGGPGGDAVIDLAGIGLLPGETFFVRVGTDTLVASAGTYDLEIDLDVVPEGLPGRAPIPEDTIYPGPDGGFDDDDFGIISALEPSLNFAGDVDSYLFAAAAAGTYRFDVDGVAGNILPAVGVYDALTGDVIDATGSSINLASATATLAEGQQVIVAFAGSDGLGIGDLDVNIIGPDSSVTAVGFDGFGDAELVDSLSDGRDADYVEFTVPNQVDPDGTVRLLLDNAAPADDFVLALYDDADNLLAFDDDLSGLGESFDASDVPGGWVANATYTLRVGTASYGDLASPDTPYTLAFDFDGPLSALPETRTTANGILVPFGPTGTSPDTQSFDAELGLVLPESLPANNAFFFGGDNIFGDDFTFTVAADDSSNVAPIAAVYDADTGSRLAFTPFAGPAGGSVNLFFDGNQGQRYVLVVSSALVNGLPPSGGISIDVDYGGSPFAGPELTLDADGDSSTAFAGLGGFGQVFNNQFSVPATADGTGTITLSPNGSADFEIYAFDDAGTIIGQSRSGGPGEDEVVNLSGLTPGQDVFLSFMAQDYGAPGGNDGTLSVDLDVTRVPDAPAMAPDLRINDDSGVDPDDNITNLPDGVPTFGFMNFNDEPVFPRLLRDGVVVSGGGFELAANSSVLFDDNTGPLVDGTYEYTLTFAFTSDGPQSDPSPAEVVTIDTQGPQFGDFSFEINETSFGGHLFFLDFDETLGRDLTPADLSVTGAFNGPLPSSDFTVDSIGSGLNNVVYDPTGDFDILPDDAYQFRVETGTITDVAGNDNELYFGFASFLQGDATRDETVNLSDFLTLRRNFGQSGALFTEGDFNYDGTVNLSDFLILRRNFGVSLFESAPPPSLFGDDDGKNPDGRNERFAVPPVSARY